MSRYVVSMPCHVCNTITEAVKYVSVSNFRIACVYICIVLINFIVLDVPLFVFILFVRFLRAPITNECEVTFVSHSK